MSVCVVVMVNIERMVYVRRWPCKTLADRGKLLLPDATFSKGTKTLSVLVSSFKSQYIATLSPPCVFQTSWCCVISML